MGTVAAIERGYRADAGLVPEPTRLEPLDRHPRASCTASFRVPGPLRPRRGQPARLARRRRRERDRARAAAAPGAGRAQRGLERARGASAIRCSASPRVQPTIVARRHVHRERARGRSSSTSTRPTCPANADADGYGSVPRGEIVAAVEGRAAADDWLAGQPACAGPGRRTTRPRRSTATSRSWRPPPQAARAAGGEGALEGIDTTYDGALLTRLAGVPSPALGPGDLGGRTPRTSGSASTS